MFTKESIRKRRDEGLKKANIKKERKAKEKIDNALYPNMRYQCSKSQKQRIKIWYDYGKYPEEDRFRMLKQRSIGICDTRQKRIEFIDFFYYNEQFNTIFNLWVACDRQQYLVPSVDHKISKINGGGDEITNLHFITYAENMWKNSMNWEEWCQFKIDMHLTADFFIRWE